MDKLPDQAASAGPEGHPRSKEILRFRFYRTSTIVKLLLFSFGALLLSFGLRLTVLAVVLLVLFALLAAKHWAQFFVLEQDALSYVSFGKTKYRVALDDIRKLGYAKSLRYSTRGGSYPVEREQPPGFLYSKWCYLSTQEDLEFGRLLGLSGALLYFEFDNRPVEKILGAISPQNPNPQP